MGHLGGGRLGGHDKDRQVGAYIGCTSSSRAREQAGTQSGTVTSNIEHNTGTNKSAERSATSEKNNCRDKQESNYTGSSRVVNKSVSSTSTDQVQAGVLNSPGTSTGQAKV